MRCLNEILEEFYFKFAEYIIRYTYIFLLLPVALTALLGSGLYFVNIRYVNDTEYLFTPTHGPAHFERKTFKEQFPFNDQDSYVIGQSFEAKHWFFVIVTGKGAANVNLLRNDILDEIDALNQFIMEKLTVESYDGLYRFTYKDICLRSETPPVCFANGHVPLFRNRVQLEEYNNEIRYPIVRMPLDKPMYVGGLIGGVVLNDTEGRVGSIGAIRLVYYTREWQADINFYSVQFRGVLENFLLHKYKSNLIDVTFGNDDSLNEGLTENTTRNLPYIAVTIVMVLMFSYICSFTFYQSSKKGIYIDWVRSKPYLAVLGTIEPGLAIISTMGFLLMVGSPFTDMAIVMPFIVFAIGVDDMFIMISAWNNTNYKDSPEKRFAEAMSEAAVAITITSFSDIVAFAMGTWNPLPAMQIFCYFTATAMFFELIYQCTFYASALYLFGCVEARSLHCVTLKKAIRFDDCKTTFEQRFKMGTILDKVAKQDVADLGHFVHHEACDHDLTLVQNFFRTKFGPFLLKPVTKAAVGVLFVVYFALGIWGSIIMPNGLQPDKLVPKDHFMYNFIHADIYWRNGLPLQILVNNPPNVSIYENRLRLHQMVSDFENTRHTMNSNYTMFWMREYERYLKDSYIGYEDSVNNTWYSSDNIKAWLKFTGAYVYWPTTLRWGNESIGEDDSTLEAFRFQVGLKDFTLPADHQDALVLMRTLFATLYPEYNITCYQQQSPYVDQYVMIYSTTIRNTVISLAIMIFIAFLLIPHPICGLFMTFSVLSIDVGVSGFLSLWDVSMDCMSMVTMIMATGFAVDLSCHVSYAYVRAEGTANERAIKALETHGWPVFQGVSATLLGVMVMGTVGSYMFNVFFKTVILVIVFGLMHSIIFLPVALSVFVPKKLDICAARKKKDTQQNVP